MGNQRYGEFRQSRFGIVAHLACTHVQILTLVSSNIDSRLGDAQSSRPHHSCDGRAKPLPTLLRPCIGIRLESVQERLEVKETGGLSDSLLADVGNRRCGREGSSNSRYHLAMFFSSLHSSPRVTKYLLASRELIDLADWLSASHGGTCLVGFISTLFIIDLHEATEKIPLGFERQPEPESRTSRLSC